jgi:hypothetical protein
MNRTGEIVTSVEGVKAGVDEARNQAGRARERVAELTEEAAGHGWDGVATAMQGAGDALEEVGAGLGTAGDAADEALSALRSITAQTSRPDVAEILGQALNSYDQVRTALDAAGSGLDDARQAVAQAGSPESLMAMLQGVNDALGDIWRGLDSAKNTTESERQEAAAWGN